MTARIVRPGILRFAGRDVEIVGADGTHVSILARSDESEDLRAMAERGAVRVIVEPAGETAAAHERIALAVDLLSQLKRAIEESGVQSSLILRCLHLVNAAHGALLGANDQHDPIG